MRQQLKKCALRAAFYTGAYRLLARRYSGIGTIFAIHKVVLSKEQSLATWLTITVEFLDRVLAYLRRRGTFVTLDELQRRLVQKDPPRTDRPFIVVTFDDGFRDTLTLGLP